MSQILAVALFGGGFLVFMLGLAIRIVAGSFGPRRTHRAVDPRARAMSILNERYATGEIDRDEYLERKAFLD